MQKQTIEHTHAALKMLHVLTKYMIAYHVVAAAVFSSLCYPPRALVMATGDYTQVVKHTC